MIVILSPAKDMAVVNGNFTCNVPFSLPQYLDDATGIMERLKQLTPEQIAGQMQVNDKIALLNHLRFQQWNSDHKPENAVCSVLAYTGEAYRGLQATAFTPEDLLFSQGTLRILSGLYGILRPLDIVQPYRLELGLGVPLKGIKSLYEFWRKKVTESLKIAIAESPGDKVLINLASAEYASVIDFKNLGFPVVAPVFKEEKSGQLKMVTVYTKKARGRMSRFIIQNRIEHAEDIKAFTEEGYYFENQLSKENEWLFVR